MQRRAAEAEFVLEERMIRHPTADIFGFEGFPEIRELEATYLPADVVSLKYGGEGR